MHALEADGLLPARRSVEQVVSALHDQGISAHPGWKYLAEHEDTATHRQAIDAAPAVVDGVVVYGDPRQAAHAIDGLDVAEVVVIAPASALAAAGTSAEAAGPRPARQAGGQVVVGPAAAQHDRTAGAAELERRRAGAGGRAAKLAEIAAQRDADARLADVTSGLLADLPNDGVAGLRRRVETARADAEAADAEEHDAVADVEALDVRAGALHAGLADRRGERDLAATRVGRLEDLLGTERDEVTPARDRLEVIPSETSTAAEAEAAADAAYAAAEATRDGCQEELAQLTQARRRWVERRAPLGQAVPGDGQPLDAAETAVADAEQALREQFPESEFRRAVAEAAREVQRAAGRLDGHRPAAQARAAQLAQLPAANEPTLRAEVQKAAAGRAVTAGQGLGTAKSELADAKRELAANTPSDRPRHAQDLPIEPADRPDAQRLARDAIAEATRVQVKVGALERDRDAAKAAANSAHIRAGMLRDQGARLHGVEPAALAVGTISAEADEVRSDVGELSADLDEADGAYQNAASGRSRAIEGLRTWASADRFREVADDEHGQAVRRLRDLLRGDDVLGRVAPRAADLAEDLADRERLIAQQLNQVEAHKRNVVARLADLADEALSDLSRASSLSELPVGIGPWDGLRFLNVECRQRPNREQIGVRVSDLVDRMVAAGKIELDPVELLWRAVEAAAGADGFRATILKPAPDQPTGRAPVEGMRKWSGGENLTASLVLFCVMAKLRAEKRSGARSGATGGVVPLDNPLGKANYLPFLHLQRRVAAVNGVQLVFWTGVADIGAVTAFPRIAAMHKRPSASAPGRAYVCVSTSTTPTGPQQMAARRPRSSTSSTPHAMTELDRADAWLS